ncbi:hypothetical protein COCSUDRAFT_26336 [Coccomyxa subellipsoidea C-169]|uniref:DUF6737 domain-containing protein n=1 Tax=Coccomyxa subellipsoidea (strain C-169) TaxID=574566 RepID=I0YJM7_COCSC|nr:hypothetical protein COCSUDRAFT_26336 [Coccomyxa subellipsoidea C-169]EIE18596.1 hypothetical protein COCSUDRAFT_26336 [Coccomyxa subellipsoidea C-169]|eukprot:XP_005643140.1 hypothetical protein COCSUDRAFT_26336 [Coccomyxa subellipsoidea C-169]
MALVRSSRSLGRGPDQTSCLHQYTSIKRRWIHQTCCIARVSSQNSAQEYRLCRARQDNHRPRRQHIYTYKPARRRRGSGRSSFTAVTSSQLDTTSGSDAKGENRENILPEQQLDTNVWAYKPFWCQPWTILGTGAALTAFANLVSHGSVLWTLVVGIPISAWWFLFLVVYPAQYREYVEEQRSFQQLDED